MVRVEIEQLVAAAAAVAGHGEDLAARQLRADNRIEAEAPGWVGRSAVALANRASVWSAASATMLTRIGQHVSELHTCAWVFSTAEAENGCALRRAG